MSLHSGLCPICHLCTARRRHRRRRPSRRRRPRRRRRRQIRTALNSGDCPHC